MKVAWVSNLDLPGPQGGNEWSLSAYVNSVLLKYLKPNIELDFFTDSISRTKSKNYLNLWLENKDRPYDAFFYQFDNSQAARIYRLALGLIPGFVWFHHYHTFDPGPAPVQNSPWTWTVSKLGNTSVDNWPTEKTEFKPKIDEAYRETGLALTPIFSNERDLHRYNISEHLHIDQNSTAYFLPMPIPERCFAQSLFDTSRDKNVFKISIFSDTTLEGRTHKTLEALSGAEFNFSVKWMVSESEESRALELIEEFETKNVTVLTGLDMNRWQDLAAECDVAIHLGNYEFQQLNPWLAISLSQGAWCVVNDNPETSYYPKTSLFQIRPGSGEVAEMRSMLSSLNNSIKGRKNIIAQQFALERYHPKTVASDLIYILQEESPRHKSILKRWSDISEQAHSRVVHQNFVGMEPDAEIQIRNAFSEMGW